jgi:hypothetical protein
MRQGLTYLMWTPAALLVLYCADWAVLRIRIAHGGGLGTVEVRHFLATPLKTHRDALDLVDTVEQPCARSVFPHEEWSACWWLQLNRDQWQAI